MGLLDLVLVELLRRRPDLVPGGGESFYQPPPESRAYLGSSTSYQEDKLDKESDGVRSTRRQREVMRTLPARQAEGSPGLLTAEEVAELLQVPKSWVYRASREGILPSIHLGRYVRFDWADVSRRIDQQKDQPDAA